MVTELKQWLKEKRDRLYSKSMPGKQLIGHEDAWTILTAELNDPVIYSGGVGKNISFELECVKKFNARVLAFDPTITGIRTARELELPPGLKFIPVALAAMDGFIELNAPVNMEEGSFTKGVHKSGSNRSEQFPCRKISSLMEEYGHSQIDILKIDIEGAEYEVLHNVLDENLKVLQICVEFHHFFESIPRRMTTDLMKRLKTSGYKIFHRRELDYSFYHKSLFN